MSRTTKVRIPVRVAHEGSWVAYGFHEPPRAGRGRGLLLRARHRQGHYRHLRWLAEKKGFPYRERRCR